MKVSEYTYPLPERLIAQHPPGIRGTSRLLVLDKASGHIQHKRYSDLVDYVQTDDVVVLNDTKVIQARLGAVNTKGQRRELLLLEDHHDTDFKYRKALYRGKLYEGEQLDVGGAKIIVKTVLDDGIVEISSVRDLLELAERIGSVPLPPYMKRPATQEDIERYQTVFADKLGSVAAPTASLNFTQELEQQLKKKGIHVVYLTLHVGLGTFLPIRSNDLEEHAMHSEYFEIPASTVSIIRSAKANGKKIVPVGTTVARTLEYCAEEILAKKSKDLSGEADIFIYPGYQFRVVDTLLTNFHAPKSTVLMLTAAFAGWKNLQYAYEEAVKEKYAFLSYGDSMLII